MMTEAQAAVPPREAHLQDLLLRCGIHSQRVEHPAVMTAAEAERDVPAMPGAKAKNLFLRERGSSGFFLVVLPFDKQADLAALSRALGSGKLSFGSVEQLAQVLGVSPGAVSLLALANDADHRCTLVIDQATWQADGLQCHPLVNTATLSLSADDLCRFLQATGHKPRVLEVPVRFP